VSTYQPLPPLLFKIRHAPAPAPSPPRSIGDSSITRSREGGGASGIIGAVRLKAKGAVHNGRIS